ncbi:MAG TPA: LLM class F420-dependent oxidoreductase [Dehalococcoidia bacterium]|nr:LLM class F420-dependent oxidoreductase [Dehalococcoidia bacterium]
MKLGAIFPQTEIGRDPGEIREFAQAVEGMGYDYIFIADHVLGADASHHSHPAYAMYNHEKVVHESMTTMGFLAAITKTVGLTTGILSLPQRQTVLVAKQAAEVDLLSGGRLRMGIGVGWNEVEYQALNQDFHNRGRRSEEQIEVMRALWSQEVVDFDGRWHRITHAGINPLPVQRPIPVWLGAGSPFFPTLPEAVLRRIARVADGWCPNFLPFEEGRQLVAQVQDYAKEAGRDPSTVGLEGRLVIAGKQPEDWLAEIKGWEELHASYVCVETRRGGLNSLDQHIDAFARVKETVGW